MRLAVTVMALSFALAAPAASLADTPQPTHEVGVVYWQANPVTSSSAGSLSVSLPLYGLSLRYEAPSGLGVYAEGLWGTESSPSGSLFGAPVNVTGGSASLLRLDVTYKLDASDLLGPQSFARLWIGGELVTENFSLAPPVPSGFTHQLAAPEVGGDVGIGLGGNLSFRGSVGYMPSASVSDSTALGTITYGSSVWGYQAGLRYSGGGWYVEAGYRWAQESIPSSAGPACPCTSTWGGVYATAGVSF